VLTSGCAFNPEKSRSGMVSVAISNAPASVLPPTQSQSQPPTRPEAVLQQPTTPGQPVGVASAFASTMVQPLPGAPQRVTKKPFGIFVSRDNSPVSPERFYGYHSGVDFEVLAEEQDIDVPVSTICSGPLLVKKWSGGYGGVAVQKCTIDGGDVTVIYGHLRLESVDDAVGAQLTAGTAFAVLGRGDSPETDGERKHLHLGIHRGADIVILGYVQNRSDLDQWLDTQTLLQK
jgi:hypothetical protein